MKYNGEIFYRIAIFASILLMTLFLFGGVLMLNQVKAEDNKTIDEPKYTRGGFPKILDDDKWSSQLVYDTIGACYAGTIRWVILNNPSLAGQPPNPMAMRKMAEHCFCVIDIIRKEYKLDDYKVKVFDPDWTGETFMLKAMECVKKYKTLPSFFKDIEIPLDNETNGETEDSKDELPSQKPKESEGFPQTIFQG